MAQVGQTSPSENWKPRFSSMSQKSKIVFNFCDNCDQPHEGQRPNEASYFGPIFSHFRPSWTFLHEHFQNDFRIILESFRPVQTVVAFFQRPVGNQPPYFSGQYLIISIHLGFFLPEVNQTTTTTTAYISSTCN